MRKQIDVAAYELIANSDSYSETVRWAVVDFLRKNVPGYVFVPRKG